MVSFYESSGEPFAPNLNMLDELLESLVATDYSNVKVLMRLGFKQIGSEVSKTNENTINLEK